jgi:hypothetical protein
MPTMRTHLPRAEQRSTLWGRRRSFTAARSWCTLRCKQRGRISNASFKPLIVAGQRLVHRAAEFSNGRLSGIRLGRRLTAESDGRRFLASELRATLVVQRPRIAGTTHQESDHMGSTAIATLAFFTFLATLLIAVWDLMVTRRAIREDRHSAMTRMSPR